MSAAVRAFQGRLQQVRQSCVESSLILTVQRSVHAPNVDQQTHHGHIDRGRALSQQLIFQDLAALAALGHGIEINVRERMPKRFIRLLGKDTLFVFEDQLQEVVLYILAPKGNTVILLQVLDLISTVDGRHAAVRISAGSSRRRRVVGSRRIAVGRWLGGILRIGCSFAVFGRRCISL